MFLRHFVIGLVATLLWEPAPSSAAVAGCVLRSGARPDLACTIANSSLPNVLYIGDSVSINTMAPLTQLLQNTANICHIYANGGASSRGAQCTRRWLNATGSGVKWDYVLFNFGIHDLELGTTGAPETSGTDYKENLRVVVNTIRRYGAVPLWVTTTPLPKSLVGPKFTDPAPYARIAMNAMATLQVPVIDTYSVILPNNETGHPPNDVHWLPAAENILSYAIAGPLMGEIGYTQSLAAPARH